MNLNLESLKNKEDWEKAGIKLPSFDIARMKALTLSNPIWIHFGAGNIFRAFLAPVQQKLLELGLSSQGITAAFSHEPEIIEAFWNKHDCLSLSVSFNADGSLETEVTASVDRALYADPSSPDWAELVNAFKSPSLQIVSYTITEKGYADTSPASAMKKTALLLLERFRANASPLAVVSMDNCSKNGEKLSQAVVAAASSLDLDGGEKSSFLSYLAEKVSFPWSMIDKITPRPNPVVAQTLKEAGFESTGLIQTELGTFVSPFVNAEKFQLLVVEDDFPNGRPSLEKGGIIFASRDSVNLAEKMKVGACLNPLHTAISIFGVLLGFEAVATATKDPSIGKLANRLGYGENLPMAADPGIISAKDFLSQCLNERFINPFLRDAPSRITTDTSQKLSARFGDTIKSYRDKAPEGLNNLEAIPLVIGGWLRYLLGVDDSGNPFEISPDPLLPSLLPVLSGITLGSDFDPGVADPILSNEAIFGLDLLGTPIANKAKEYFKKLSAAPGAVRKTLDEFAGS